MLIGGAAGLAIGLEDMAAAVAASAAAGTLGIGVTIGAGCIAVESGRAVAQEGSTTHWVEPWPR